jgi:Cys-tRNA(Pro)/Cys-tRNA(Cys) deacylase
MIRNNVTRLLDSREIPYEVFELPRKKLSALEAASYLGVSPGLVYKTIVVTRQYRGKPLLVLIPADKEVDLKALARFLGEKKVQLPTERQAEALTGLQAGGISPLALLNRGFQVVIDSSAGSRPEIYISGGQRGLNLRLPVAALISLTGARLAGISAFSEPT